MTVHAGSSGLWSEAADRRLRRVAEVCREFGRSRSGVAGAVILLAVIVLALLAPVLTSHNDLVVSKINNPLNAAPSWRFPLGTDPSGRSVLVSLLWGSRTSLLIGILSATLSMVLGTVVGMVAAHYRGILSAVLMRLIDFFLVVPSLVLAIVLASVIGRNVTTIIIAIGVTSWAGTARVVRSQALTVEARPYIERSVALGASHRHVLNKHVLPGVMPLVLANTTLTVGVAILTESSLAFLGISDPTATSWGGMLELALSSGAAAAGYWWFVLTPGLAIVVVVLAFTMVGRTLEVIVNPTLRAS